MRFKRSAETALVLNLMFIISNYKQLNTDTVLSQIKNTDSVLFLMSPNRLKQIISELGISQKEFAISIGLTPSSLNDILMGRTKGISKTLIMTMSFVHKINPTWLMTGRGDMFLRPYPKTNESTSNGNLTLHEGNAEIYQVDEDNIHHTIWWEHLSPAKRFIAAGLPELSDEDAEKLRNAVEVMVLAERKRQEDEEKEKKRLRQKGEAGKG